MWSAKDGAPEGNGKICSDVVVMDDRAVATGMPPGPMVSTLNVTKSSKVHIGPKIVSVTQNVHNAEMIKGRFVGLELVSSKHSRRVRCSVAVFICWALIVAIGLIIYLIYVAMPKQTRLDIGLNETWYLRRGDWQAMPAYAVNFLQLPLSNVIIGHSAAASCQRRFDCIETVMDIQQNHLRRSFDDIGPNFLVGGDDGWVFEGRGANVFGAMIVTYNRISISIMFIGDYTKIKPNQNQFDHVNILLDRLVEVGVLRPDYTVWGQCQVNPDTVSPGWHLVENLDSINNWNSSNTQGCLR